MEKPTLTEIKEKKTVPDFVFKIVIVGDSSVGKTNILSQYVNHEFKQDSKATIGIEMSSKVYQINDEIINANLWDTAGQERFQSMTKAFYKGAKGAMIVYDITKRESFDNVDKWFKEINTNGLKNMIVYLVGNKCDLTEKRQVSAEEGIEKAKNLNIAFMETSAFDATNIDNVFRQQIIDIFLFTIKETSENIDEMELEKDMICQNSETLKINTKTNEKKKCAC